MGVLGMRGARPPAWAEGLGVAGLALALRLAGIDAQSMWADEGGTLALAGRAPTTILRDTLADVHPPLYYWLLHAWMTLAGATPASARGLSALLGALAALATFALARRWYGPVAARLAGMAAAASPLAVYYGQEARMYALAALLAALLFLALDDWLARPSPARLLAGALCSAALLATHYFAAIAVGAGLLAATLVLLADPQEPAGARLRRAAWLWLAHAPPAALYLAMVLASRERLAGWTAAKQPTGPTLVLSDSLSAFAGGLAPPAWAGWWWPAACGALLLCGVIAGGGRGRPGLRPRQAALLWLGLPLAAMVLISLGQPYYKPRFLLPALPAFHILLGAGAAAAAAWAGRRSPAAGRAAPWAAAALIAAMSGASLWRGWTDPSTWRDDYRGAARAIDATAGPRDALVLNGQSQIDTLDLYLRAPLPRALLPRVRPLDPAAVTADLAALAADHRRIYGLFYVIEESDPQGVMAGWLDSHAFPSGARWYGALLVRTWETGDLSGELRPSGATFGQLAVAEALAADRGPLRPGDAARVQAVWRLAGPGAPPLSVFLHLVGSDGRLLAQYDGPLGAPGPDGTWPGRMAVIVPPGAPPGRYRLLLGVYDPASGARLTLPSGDDTLAVADLEVR